VDENLFWLKINVIEIQLIENYKNISFGIDQKYKQLTSTSSFVCGTEQLRNHIYTFLWVPGI